MQKISKIILSNWPKINPIGLRYVRRRVNKEASAEPAIEVVEEKIDVKSLNIPTAARLALENDPKLKENFTKKQLKFSFDAETVLNEASKTSKTLDLSTLNDLTEDASVPKSRISCPGCGARLHCQNRNEEGFISADAFKSLKKKELPYTLCFRCDLLKTKKTLLNLEIDSKFDYEKFVLDRIRSESKSHVILLIDLLDIPNSIYDGWSKLIHKIDSQSEEVYEKKKLNDIDIVIVGNKFDLLPNTGPLFEKSIVECLLHNCSIKGIRGEQVKHVELISAKTGYNVERLITRLFKLWNDEGDVYLLGMANAGKSMLFNKLLSSDYCRSLASEAIVRATTSFWPGTTLNMLKFPINFLTSSKKSIRQKRLFSDAEELDKLETQRRELYEKTKNLKFAQVIGTVGSSFKPHSILDANEIDANIDATYSLDTGTNQIVEGSNYEGENDIKKKRVDEARRIYKPHLFTDSSAWFYDTPGILGSQEILRCFSKKELQIVFPLGLIMPRVFWMVPGESLFVGGLIRIDLLEVINNFSYYHISYKVLLSSVKYKSTKDERVLFSIMTSPALPIINPFKTSDAERLYNEYYEEGNVLRVPYKNHPREKPLPPLESKVFEIGCIGNYKSTADIVFNCFGWSAVTSRPETKALVRAWTLGVNGLHLRQPSLLPFIVNMRKKWSRTDGSQAFKSVYYKKPKL